MSQPYISQRVGERYSVANSATILIWLQPFDECLDALLAAGVPATTAVSILEDPAPPSQWLATAMSAAASSITDIGDVVSTLPTSEDTDSIRNELGVVADQLITLTEQITAEKKQAKIQARIAQLENWIESNLESYQSYLAGQITGIDISNLANIRRVMMRDTAAGQELSRLRGQR